MLLYVIQQSNQVTVKAWTWQPGELPVEHDAPDVVPSNEVTFLAPYGSVFFATAPLIEKELPDVTRETHNAVVMLGLRGVEDLGSTFLGVLERYALDLRQHHSKLVLVGVGPLTRDQLEKTRIAATIGRENIFMRTETIGEAATLAWDAARKWLAEQPEPSAAALEKTIPEEPAEAGGRNNIREQVEKIGESATRSWHTAREWITDRREPSGTTAPDETNPDQGERQSPTQDQGQHRSNEPE